MIKTRCFSNFKSIQTDPMATQQPPPAQPCKVWRVNRVDLSTVVDAPPDAQINDDADDQWPLGNTPGIFTFAQHAQLNTRNYNQQLAKVTDALPNDPAGRRRYLKSPTGSSGLPSNCMHPWFYAFGCGAGIQDLDALGSPRYLDAPGDWRAWVDAALQEPRVAEARDLLTMEVAPTEVRSTHHHVGIPSMRSFYYCNLLIE